jgi:hypothetical protein
VTWPIRYDTLAGTVREEVSPSNRNENNDEEDL